MTALPIPLVPAEVDLRKFPYMPLHVARLRDAEIAVRTTGDEFRCAVLLWCASWHQVPAASLPDDDVVLSDLAGFGRVLKEWRKVRTGALRGWVKCSDGRLYHPVVAEVALDSWRSLLKGRWRTELERVKKHYQRHKMPMPDLPDFEHWISLGCPQGHSLPVPGDKVPESSGTSGASPQGHPPPVPSETGVNRSKQNRRVNPISVVPTTTTEPSSDGPPPTASSSDVLTDEQAERTEVIAKRLRKLESGRGLVCAIHAKDPRLVRWVQAGIRDPDLREAYDLAVAQRQHDGDPSPINAGFLDRFVAKLLNPRGEKSAVVGVVKAWHETASGIAAKGADLGLIQADGEAFPYFKARVFAAAGHPDGGGQRGQR